MSTWSWKLLRAGAFRLDGGSMFGVAPRTIWSTLAQPDADNRIGLQTNCLLLEHADQRVLIETGFGSKWTDRERGFYDLEHRTVIDALAEVDCAPAQIDLVIVTHLHFDHAGGLTHLDESGRAVSTFSNAEIVTQRVEWNDALANKSTMTRTYLRDHLDPIADQVRLVDGEQEIAPAPGLTAGLTVWPMIGHTWGQQAVRFDDDEGVVCFPGDCLPTINHVGPSFNMGYDMLPFENMRSKHELLARAAQDEWRLVLDHEPGDPVRRVMRDSKRDDRFLLEPAE